jgi:3-dehydroquinate dehydratase I
MAQLVSSKNLLTSSRPLAVGVVSQPETLRGLPGDLTSDCDAVELRLDLLGLPTSEVRAGAARINVPILLTARHPAEGGKGSENAAERAALIEPLLDLAALIDIELRSIGEMKWLIEKARARGIPIVGSFHDFQATPADEVLEGAISFAENSGIDTVKIAAFINSPDDLLRMAKLLTAKRRLRISMMGMGPWGRVSRLLLAKCGSLLNYGFLGDSNAPGQWPAAQLKALLAEI